MTTVANGRCTSAPAPLLRAMGRKPSEATLAVISTGRRRLAVPMPDPLCDVQQPFLPQVLELADEHDAVEHRHTEQGDEAHTRRDAERHAPSCQREHATDRG